MSPEKMSQEPQQHQQPAQGQNLSVPSEAAGMRLDAFLAGELGISRAKAASQCDEGAVFVDGKPALKSSKLKAGSSILVQDLGKEELLLPRPEPIPDMDILYADEDLIFINKPVGVAAHPAAGWDGPTVVGGLLAAGFKLANDGPPERPGIVHRIDVGTSGIMVVAASSRAFEQLSAAFRDRTVHKIYHALIQGTLKSPSGTIDAPIGRHPTNSWKFAVVKDGRDAITHYKTLESFHDASLIEVHLETGRTHQVRVHMAAAGHACVGDPMYGSDPNLTKRAELGRQWLHAVSLGLTHPGTGELIEVTAPYPRDLNRALEVFRDS